MDEKDLSVLSFCKQARGDRNFVSEVKMTKKKLFARLTLSGDFFFEDLKYIELSF